MPKFSFAGGVYIPNPHATDKLTIIKVPPPKTATLLLQQRVGGQAQPCVEVGEHVLTGQIIATSNARGCAPKHASISGVVSAIELMPIPHPSGIPAMCMTIESDGQDKWVELDKCKGSFLDYSTQEIVAKIKNAGIVGMGGAGFPTHIKINNSLAAKTIIINATECEPGIMCDDAVMQNYTQEVLRGIEILLYICAAKEAIIAIEDDKKIAFEALTKHNNNAKIKIQKIPTKYTSGAEKLLIKAILGMEIPSGKFSYEIGVLCQNVGTVKAIYDAVIDGRPLVSRVMTVTGSGVQNPQNYETRLGTAFSDVVAYSKPNNQAHEIRMGGMMMGVNIKHTNYFICKITNCIFINNKQAKIIASPCIRCGACNEVCPIGLLPQQLYWNAKGEKIDKALDYNLMDCIECGCCDYICPSHIPLVSYFTFAKALHKKQQQEQIKANKARERFEYREHRLERNKQERATMMAAKRQELKDKMAAEASQKQQIAQAIKRVKDDKEGKNA